MKSAEAARRFRAIADEIDALGDDGLIVKLGVSTLPLYGERRILIGFGVKETKKHFAFAGKIERIAHAIENSGPEQLELKLEDDLLTQHLKRK